MVRGLTEEQKDRRRLWGGISGLVIGFWMLFITRTYWGFVPAIMGALLLILKRD